LVTEGLTQHNVQHNPKRLAQSVPKYETGPGISCEAACEVQPRAERGQEPASEKDGGSSPAMIQFLGPPDAISAADADSEAMNQLASSPTASGVADLIAHQCSSARKSKDLP